MGASIENSTAAYLQYLIKINELEDNRTEPCPAGNPVPFVIYKVTFFEKNPCGVIQVKPNSPADPARQGVGFSGSAFAPVG